MNLQIPFNFKNKTNNGKLNGWITFRNEPGKRNY